VPAEARSFYASEGNGKIKVFTWDTSVRSSVVPVGWTGDWVTARGLAPRNMLSFNIVTVTGRMDGLGGNGGWLWALRRK